MADLTGVNVDPNVKENSGAFTVIPQGNYNAVIVSDKLYDNKKNTGKILELTWQIIEGQNQGLTVTDRLNIINASQVAQNIGQGSLKRICNICNVPYPPQNTDTLYGIPVSIFVKVETFVSNTTGKELESNNVAGYNPVSEVPKSNTSQTTTHENSGW